MTGTLKRRLSGLEAAKAATPSSVTVVRTIWRAGPEGPILWAASSEALTDTTPQRSR
jgi:hypothetical protein